MARRLLTLILALGLVAAACSAGDDGRNGNDEQPTDEEAVAAAIAAQFDTTPGTPFDDVAAACVAERMVAAFGVDRLAELGVTAELAVIEDAAGSMSDAEIEALADLLLGCVDFAEVFVTEMMGDGISRPSAQCLTDAVADTDFFRDLLLAGVSVGFDAARFDAAFDGVLELHFGTFLEAMGRCLTAEELIIVLGGDPTPLPHPDAEEVSVFDLEMGDCFDDPPFADQVGTVPRVPCSEPHDNEVYLVADLPDGPYPGRDEVAEMADELCLAAFEPFVGTDHFDSELTFFTLTPTEASWEEGDRAVICSLYAFDLSKLEGTMRDSGR